MQQLERAAPSGEAVFLFSDIEGSTARWQMYPDAMPAHLHRHDDILRAAIEENGGTVFKTVGDEFCAVFVCADDAIRAAIDAQHAISANDWTAIGGLRVRMAVHAGPVTHRDGDYFGSTVNRVARLLSAGHGGQVLLSADTVEALSAAAVSGFSLRDLGRHRLKDFSELQSIYQLLAPDLPEIFPPLRTVAERPSNLPQHLPALLGREDQLAQLRQRVEAHRLVTIVGAGGVGKTAIAVQLGADLLDSFDDGVWLAELAPVDSGAVDSTIAGVFGLVSVSSGSIVDALIAQLRNKSLLLVVDNCEHVAESAAGIIDAVLRNCANVRILATSRQPLGLNGEVSYRLPVLAVPSESAVSAEEIKRYGACELFEERARVHMPGFQITDANAKTVSRICRRLDGIPLAIELAAPRLRVMNVTQLADRLAERFRVLTGGNRNALPHHQTLRALIEWSYELLSENERVLLRRSALFPGGWTIGGAVEVCADETLEEWDILDHLSALVDKSLVIADTSEDEPRYRMLESTREYAIERLEESGERNIVALKHAEYFLRLAHRADEAWPSVPAKAWIAPLNAELDNVRAALSWCVAQKNYPILGIRIFDCLEAFWWDAQPIEGRRWIEELREIAQSDEASAEAGRYWLSSAGIALSAAKEKLALGAAEKALEIYRGLNDPLGIGAAQRCRGAALIRLGKLDEGEDATSQALQTFREFGNHRLVAIALRTLATAPILRGDMEKAAAIYREALSLSQALQDERGVQIIAGNLAELDAHAGNFEDALTHAREAHEIARERQDWVMVCTLLINITAYLLMLERRAEARSTARDALDVACEIQSDIHLAVAIQHLAAVAATCGDAARAARLLGYTDAAYARLENEREPTEAREYERAMSALKLRMGDDDLLAHVRAGALLTPEQAKGEALLT
jgi:predicted ATPase/class 3 adenylate cyclase